MDFDEFAKMNDTRISIQDFPSTLTLRAGPHSRSLSGNCLGSRLLRLVLCDQSSPFAALPDERMIRRSPGLSFPYNCG